MKLWKPDELFIHDDDDVKNDDVTRWILRRCGGVPVTYVTNARKDIAGKSKILNKTTGFLEKILAGKHVLYVAPGENAVDTFQIDDLRMKCPAFPRLKLSSNGCFFACEWCYLKLTYRHASPFIEVRVQYEKIKKQLEKKLSETTGGVMCNAGELGDSLSLDHLARAAASFIPWFGTTVNGHLFMLTKSAAADHLLKLRHNGRTVLAWSLNAPEVSKRYEKGAPPFTKRLEAARKAQEAGYPVRVRLDPIVPIEKRLGDKAWREIYSRTIREIFKAVTPERVTLGTLRFERNFHRMRGKLISQGCDLLATMKGMNPMFSKDPGTGKVGKYSFDIATRSEIFAFALGEIRKHSDCPVALCKEERKVWDNVGLDLSRCACVCQLHAVDMT